MMQQQNTHWYKSANAHARGGFTADPTYAKDGEIGRIGYHVCAELGCTEIHAGSKEWMESR